MTSPVTVPSRPVAAAGSAAEVVTSCNRTGSPVTAPGVPGHPRRLAKTKTTGHIGMHAASQCPSAARRGGARPVPQPRVPQLLGRRHHPGRRRAQGVVLQPLRQQGRARGRGAAGLPTALGLAAHRGRRPAAAGPAAAPLRGHAGRADRARLHARLPDRQHGHRARRSEPGRPRRGAGQPGLPQPGHDRAAARGPATRRARRRTWTRTCSARSSPTPGKAWSPVRRSASPRRRWTSSSPSSISSSPKPRMRRAHEALPHRHVPRRRRGLPGADDLGEHAVAALRRVPGRSGTSRPRR